MMPLINFQSLIRFDFDIQDCLQLLSDSFFILFKDCLFYHYYIRSELFELHLCCLQKLADLSTTPSARLIDGILLTKFDTIDDKVDTNQTS